MKRSNKSNTKQLFDLNHQHPPQSLNFAELLHLNETTTKQPVKTKQRRPLPPLPKQSYQSQSLRSKEAIPFYDFTQQNKEEVNNKEIKPIPTKPLPIIPPRTYQNKQQLSQSHIIFSTNESERISPQKKSLSKSMKSKEKNPTYTNMMILVL